MESQALRDLGGSPDGAAAGALIEREAPLTLIARALSEAREGRGSVVAIDGARGLGESRLLELAREPAAEEGMDVLSARGREAEQDFTFGVLLQLFEARVARANEEVRGR